MKEQLQAPEIIPSEWIALNQFLFEIDKIKSPCISVYYPYGKGQETVSLLKETKRKENFEKIESEIQNRILQLRKNPTSTGKFTKTICIFGWMENQKPKILDIGTSKKLPYIYMENKRPYTKPFQDILRTSYNAILIIIDQKSAKIQKFYGSKIVKETKISIDLQGRHKKGGQSQGRFLRARQTKIHVFFKKVVSKIRDMSSNSEIILLGGPGTAKTEFHGELDSETVKKCRFVQNISFSSSSDQVYKKVIDHLYQFRRKQVAEKMQEYQRKVKQGLTEKNNTLINKALNRGAVDTLIVSAVYHTNSQFKKIMRMLEIAKKTGAKIEFTDSPKIIKRLDIDDSVLAILRYKIK